MTEKIRKTRFYQTNSYVVLDYATKFASVTSLNPDAAHPLAGISINRLEVNDVEPLRTEITAFLDAIEQDYTPQITGEDGRRALALAIGVLDNIEQHMNRLQSTGGKHLWLSEVCEGQARGLPFHQAYN